MKLRNLFLVVALAFVAMSCEKSEESTTAISTPVVESLSASISLQIAGTDGVQTRAAGNPVQEEMILKLDAFVFNVNGTLEAYKNVTSATNTITKVDNIAVTSGAKKVFVLANYAGDASKIKTLDNLKAALADLSNEKDNGRLTMSTEIADVTIIAGKNYIGYSSDVDGAKLAPQSYTLTRLVSRVKLVDMQWQGGDYTFDDISAYVLNAAKTSLLVTAGTVTAPTAYYQGFAGIAGNNLYPATSEVLSGAANFLTSPAVANSTYFYMYENQPVNDVITYPTMLVLKAKVKLKGKQISNIAGFVDADGYTYYPVVINKVGTSTNHTYVKRNNTYSIRTVVKGLGTSTPFSTQAPASSLSAEVSVASWALDVQQTETFNY